ncbi:PREDICTED: kinesin-like protein KIN-14G [Lupinus angustifolius]|uniref:kinesin-like protein KIN-14G n=1 Tax=Lupinus angustifolius TaxID=3871 RepID=UPI00092F107A|nr:PREDICTED: kinesin-like protein KIN-14G [Lupinus angustifolius]
MATKPVMPFSVISVVEDVLQKHGGRLSDLNLASRKAEEASLRRNEASGWLGKMVGGKELPAEPSEEDFRIALRSGIILCNALNKVQPGAVPKVVEAPSDIDIIPDGAALSVYQYFENVRNFLVAVEEMGLPTFEASDLEQVGKSSRIVNCVLALKSYSEWKMGGKNGLWKYGGSPKPLTSVKQTIVRKISEPFSRSLSRAMSLGDKDGWPSDNASDPGHDSGEGGSIPSLNTLVREFLSDKKPEEIPILVESMLGKVMEEFEQRILILQETLKSVQEDKSSYEVTNSNLKGAFDDEEMEENDDVEVKQKECHDVNYNGDEKSCSRISKQQKLVKQQNENVQELKVMVHQTKTGVQFLQKKYQEEFIYLRKHLYSIASAASGYHKVLEENRKLYNQVQDLKGNIRVYCRVRPLTGAQTNHHGSVSNVNEGSISLIIPSKNGKEGKKTFSFNRVFGPSATQGEVFSDTQPLIRSVLDGYNVCIFAYGQTGSGKTHTMTGPNNLTEETVGVNYRALRDLFLLSEQRRNTIHYDISVQMLEIYNEQVRDLLTTDGAHKRLDIRNSSNNGINVPDANLVPVTLTSDVLNLMNMGHKNRTVSYTAMNDRSSRSHSCLMVHVQGRDLTSGNSLRGCMHLVDLAGSERVDKSEVTGDQLKEAQHINKSLSALGDVIASLSQKHSHVPYRNSKLTQLLQDSLGGQAKTLMFVHISPEPEALGETISTLKFAERVSTVELGAARVNKDGSDVKELKEQIASLKAALARKKGEPEHFQQSANSIAEIPRLKSHLSSPVLPSWTSGGVKLPRDDSASSLEDQKTDGSELKSRSIDLEDMSRNPPQWTDVGNNAVVNGKEEDKESVSKDWGNRSMNRNNSLTIDDSLVGHWEAESKHISSPMISPTYLSVPSRIFSEIVTTDDFDELELATSECSDLSDISWQSNVTKAYGHSNGIVSNVKKSPRPKQAKNQETRSMIRSLIPSSSRKQVTVVSQPRKQPGSIDAKRSRNAK